MPLKASVVSDSADAPSWPSRKQAQRVKTLPAQAGLCVKTVQAWRGVDSTDKVFINCVHHEAVELPMTMGNTIDEDYMDHKGLEGLRIPLLVGQKRAWTDEDGVVSTIVDVLFNPVVIRRCWPKDEESTGGFDSQYYRDHLADLSKKFVQQDTGLTLSKRYMVLKNCRYKGGAPDTPKNPLPFALPEELQQERQQMEEAAAQEHAARKATEGSSAAPKIQPVEPTGAKGSSGKGKKQKKGKQEKGSKMNLGFFGKVGEKSDKTTLYPGGSNEGVLPEGAGEPFGWMPKKLRERVNICDTSTTSEEQQRKMMENYANGPSKSSAGKSNFPAAQAPSADASSQSAPASKMNKGFLGSAGLGGGAAQEPARGAAKSPMVSSMEAMIEEERQRQLGQRDAEERLQKEQEAQAASLASVGAPKVGSMEVENGVGAADALAKAAASAFAAKDFIGAARRWGESLACLRAVKAPDSSSGVRQLKVQWHNNRAMALLQLGQYAEVEADCTQVLSFEPDNQKALYRRGTARCAQLKWVAAVRDLERVLQALPDNKKAARQLEQAKAALAAEAAEVKAVRAKAAASQAKAKERAEAEQTTRLVDKMAEATAALNGMGEDERQAAAEEQRKKAEEDYWNAKLSELASKEVGGSGAGGGNSGGQLKRQADLQHNLQATPEGYQLLVELPGVRSMKAVELAVSEDEVVVKHPTQGQLRVFLPNTVDVDSTSAKFNKKEKGAEKLIIQLTCLVTSGLGDHAASTGEELNYVPEDAFEREAAKIQGTGTGQETVDLMKDMEFMMQGMDSGGTFPAPSHSSMAGAG